MKRVVLTCSALLSGCIFFKESGKIKHDPNQIMVQSANQWIALTAEEFEQVREPEPTLEPTHPLVVRAQQWADIIDAGLRSQPVYADIKDRIPRPIVRISRSNVANAYVSQVPVCFPVATKIEKSSPGEGRPYIAEKVMISQNGDVIDFVDKCIDGASKNIDLSAVLRDVGSRHPGCKLELKEGKVVVSGNCPNTSGVDGASGIVFPFAANIISVYLPIFVGLPSEESFVSVLGHELGHYYRAHSVTNRSANYFYRQETHTYGTTPKRDPEVVAVGDIILNSRWVPYTNLPQQLMDPRLTSNWMNAYGLMARLSSSCTDETCKQACIDWEQFVSGVNTDPFIYYPFEEPADLPNWQTVYLEGEKKFLGCAKNVRINADSFVPSYERNEAITQPIALSRIIASLIGENALDRIIHRPVPFGSWLAKQPLNTYSSLDKVFMEVSKALVDERNQVEGAFATAATQNLGYYTFEQEADDIAAEVLAAIGISPDALLEQEIHFRKLVVNLSGNDPKELEEIADCEKQWRAGWKDPAGNPVIIPLGGFFDTHHGFCYRIFNSSHEIEGHRYQVSTNKPRPAEATPWPALQQQAKELTVIEARVAPRGANQPLAKSRNLLRPIHVH